MEARQAFGAGRRLRVVTCELALISQLTVDNCGLIARPFVSLINSRSIERSSVMKIRIISVAAAVAVLVTAFPVMSHHSNSAYQVDHVVTLTGIVKEWKWTNPHTWLYLTVDDLKEGKVEWAVEGRAPGVLGRAGWDRTV